VKDKTGQVIPVHAVTSHGGSQHLHAFLTSALDFRLCHYPQGNRPWYRLDRRLGRPHNGSGHFAEEENLFFVPGIESSLLGCPARKIVSIASEL
jgi:hypothetical protein